MDNNVTENVAEKAKSNNKNIIIAVIVIAAIAIIGLIVYLAGGGSYKITMNKFEKAMDSKDSMEEFVDKNANLRAFYAMNEATDGEDDEDKISEKFVEEYKKAKKSDYNTDEIKDLAYPFFTAYADQGITVEKVGELKSTDTLDVYSVEIKIKGLKVCTITLKSNEDDSTMKVDAYFYKGKIIMIIPDLSSIEY